VQAAYNYAEHPAERRKMMQAWADYPDGLRNDAAEEHDSVAAGRHRGCDGAIQSNAGECRTAEMRFV
jgi:hypothetical protein